MDTPIETDYLFAAPMWNRLMVKKHPPWADLSSRRKGEAVSEMAGLVYAHFSEKLGLEHLCSPEEETAIMDIMFREPMLNAEQHGHAYEFKPALRIQAVKKPESKLYVGVDQEKGYFDVRDYRIAHLEGGSKGLDMIIDFCSRVTSTKNKVGGMELGMTYRIGSYLR